ncbi:MAG: hypothetical protein HYW02_03325 [Deltaproteobacteria bacterium]|nr:hypothetical protein [Deltaproteobacteria bacterium]
MSPKICFPSSMATLLGVLGLAVSSCGTEEKRSEPAPQPTPEEKARSFLQGSMRQLSQGHLTTTFLNNVRGAVLNLIPSQGPKIDLLHGEPLVPITLQRVLMSFSRQEEKVAFYQSIVSERPSYEDQLCNSARILLGIPAMERCPSPQKKQQR